MSVYRVPVVWAGTPTVGGGLSNFYFNSTGGTVAQAVTSVVDFLVATEASRSNNLSWSCGGDIDTLNVGTGALEDQENFTPAVGTGGDGGDELPPISQGLLRLTTGQIVSGRLLRGRLFIPGATETSNTAGFPTTTFRNDYNDAADAMIADANSAWSVWSRTHGTLATITSASMWTQWASLRSRRD